MLNMASVHSILDKSDWSLNEIQFLLEQDASSINDLDALGFAPLQRALKDDKCSFDIIKCLLFYGANPKCVDSSKIPLSLSILHNRGKEITKLLIDAGAEVKNVFDAQGHSPLCIALCCGPDEDLLQMLLDAGCDVKECATHISALHCAMSNPNLKLTTNVCKMLINKDRSFLFLRETGALRRHSFLCLALSWKAEPETIRLIVEAGCSMNECSVHDSVFLCATLQCGELETDMVKLLLDVGAAKVYDINHSYNNYNTSLNHILKNYAYELDAIKLLFDCESKCISANGNIYDVSICLLNAVKNINCKPDIVKFLIDKGGSAEALDSKGRSLMHMAVNNMKCQPAIIQILLNNGCSVTVTYGANQYTPLRIALDKERSSIVVNMLLKSGARIKAVGNVYEVMRRFLLKYASEESDESINLVKLLLKYVYLEDPRFNIKNLALGRQNFSVFSVHIRKCKSEIQILKQCNIFQYVSRYSEFKQKAEEDQLLKIPLGNVFPVYFDVISATYGREAMEEMLKVLIIYFMTNGPNSMIVVLNYYILLELAGYLSDEDLFSLLVAFYSDKLNTNASSSDEIKSTDKRKSEELEENTCKRSRLSQ